jgi:AcrR family transcriptional regulator
MKKSEAKTVRGRPMDSKVHNAILTAVLKLLETQNVVDLTIKGIAQAAGVTRPAIYRRWSTPIDIALDAFLETTEQEISVDVNGDPAEALAAHILAMTRFMRSPRGRLLAVLLGAAQSDTATRAAFRERFLKQRRKHGRILFERGMNFGKFDADLDIELAIDLYAGPIYYRALGGHQMLSDKFAKGLAKRVLRAVQA